MGDSTGPTTHLSLLVRLRDTPDDQGAWAEFVARYQPRLYAWCRQWRLQDADAHVVSVPSSSRPPDATRAADTCGIFAIVFGSVGLVFVVALKVAFVFDVIGLVLGFIGFPLARARGGNGVCSVVGVARSVAGLLLFLIFRLRLLHIYGY